MSNEIITELERIEVIGARIRNLKIFPFSILTLCFSQCQNIAENTLINSPNIVDKAKFPDKEYAYVKSYSFNRIVDLDSMDNIIAEMNHRKGSSHHEIKGVQTFGDDIEPIDAAFGDPSIIDENGKLTFQAQSIKKLSTSEIQQLQNILIEDINGVRDSERCITVPRDALVFYGKNDEVVNVLNFDLGCYGTNISFESKNWEALRQFFIDLGHPIFD